jgi:16S rRNA (adenine1518-N6/adenine1519-N6)-dimethyltransferase
MLQREVVERISAPAGSSERGYLSVFVEAYCETEKLFDVAPSSFKPAPKIWSSVVRLKFRPQFPADVTNEKLLWQVVSAGFAQRRKTILNNLRSAPSPLQETLKNHGGSSIVLCQAEVGLQRRASRGCWIDSAVGQRPYLISFCLISFSHGLSRVQEY